MSNPILSICIPTFNRRAPLLRLLEVILATDEPVEVCVHIDGSDDGTLEALTPLASSDVRLKIGAGPNRGRAHAMAAAISMATAPYTMIYDDDDDIYPAALARLCEQLTAPLPAGVCGYIYLMEEHGREGVTAAFPAPRSNFLKLRADEGVVGDMKEVVSTPILLAHLRRAKVSRRMPTSATWAAIALDHDVLCRNEALGAKQRITDGLTLNITRNKLQSPMPMVGTHWTRVRGFFRGRYRSPGYLVRSLAAACFYAAVSVLRAPRLIAGTLTGKAA